MASRGIGKGSGRERARRDVGSPFGLDLVSALDPALDDGDGSDFWEARGTRIGTLRIDPVHRVGDRLGADLDAAMVLADCLDLLDFMRWRRP
jgi:hypothetical protein